ncbi:hypothetical protein EPN54_04450, partial [bacterium]
TIFKLQPAKPERLRGVFSSLPKEMKHAELSQFEATAAQEIIPESTAIPNKQAPVSTQSNQPKVGRNDPCPCGAKDPATGIPIKYKKCHGR